jgi:hypothetical protein
MQSGARSILVRLGCSVCDERVETIGNAYTARLETTKILQRSIYPWWQFLKGATTLTMLCEQDNHDNKLD